MPHGILLHVYPAYLSYSAANLETSSAPPNALGIRGFHERRGTEAASDDAAVITERQSDPTRGSPERVDGDKRQAGNGCALTIEPEKRVRPEAVAVRDQTRPPRIVEERRVQPATGECEPTFVVDAHEDSVRILRTMPGFGHIYPDRDGTHIADAPRGAGGK
jgi:hypothetical protein